MTMALPGETLRSLGDFELVRQIGRGGMGIVYEAKQVSLNRRVALKVLNGGLGLSHRAVLRFRLEAEAAAKLHHTNIVPVYTTGEAGGTHFYAMELIEGPSLDQVLDRLRHGPPGTRRLAEPDDTGSREELPSPSAEETVAYPDATPGPPAGGMQVPLVPGLESGSGGSYFDAVARMIAEVADALDYAHRSSVIHRDIKPSNLLLSPDGRLSLNDFGLARVLERPGVTVTGEFVGTPRYMSPEQITAGRAPLDHRTDIFSLGATLYELLTLRPPFPGERRDQVIAQILHKDPTPPRRVDRRIPLDLETICLKGLEKDPDRRYQAAGAMAEDLRRYVSRHAISARRTGPLGRSVKWARRHPALAAVASVATVAMVAAASFAYSALQSHHQLREERLRNTIERAQLAAMSGEFAEAERAVSEAEMLGASAGWVRLVRGQVAYRRGNYAPAIRDLEQAIRLLPDNFSARATLALAFQEDGQPDRCFPILEYLNGRRPAAPEDALFLGMIQTFSAPGQALATLDKAVSFPRTAPMARAVRAATWGSLATETGDPSAAEHAVEEARVARVLLPDNPIIRGYTLSALLAAASTFESSGQDGRRREALAEAERDYGAIEEEFASQLVVGFRWMYLRYLGNHRATFDLARRSWQLPARRPMDASFYALVLYEQGRVDEALTVIEDSRRGDVYRAARDTLWIFALAEGPGGPDQALAALRELSGDQRATGNGAMRFTPELFLFLGRRDEAVALAKEMGREGYSWPTSYGPAVFRRFFEYVEGRAGDGDLLAAAGRSHNAQCLAHYWIAMRRLGDGDRAGARDHFGLAVATRAFWLDHYDWSATLLDRMKADPEWPHWIR
jgi:serine/threonine protein kinase